MSTLETQYRKFLEANQKLKISFEEWKKVNARLVKQALINMMKDDEELGLYDEPFRHKVETIPAEEILANRSNAYEFIDFDKQETLEEAALRKYQYTSANPPYTIITPKDKVQGFIDGAKWQQERSYSEEDMKQAYCNGANLDYNIMISTKEGNEILDKWFKEIKKK